MHIVKVIMYMHRHWCSIYHWPIVNASCMLTFPHTHALQPLNFRNFKHFHLAIMQESIEKVFCFFFFMAKANNRSTIDQNHIERIELDELERQVTAVTNTTEYSTTIFSYPNRSSLFQHFQMAQFDCSPCFFLSPLKPQHSHSSVHTHAHTYTRTNEKLIFNWKSILIFTLVCHSFHTNFNEHCTQKMWSKMSIWSPDKDKMNAISLKRGMTEK